MLRKRRQFPGIPLLLMLASANAAPLFENHSVLEVELAGPITSVMQNDAGKSEHSFLLSTSDAQYDLAVRLRGNSRLRVCDFRPLRLRFLNEQPDKSDFAGQSKLKLVTHCRNNDRAEHNVLEEYLAYRIFNVLSDFSYRVRLLRIRYSDTDGKLKKSARHRYGFLIESSDELAARMESSAAEVPGVSRNALVPQQAALVYVFQYMIGNTDWSIVTADTDDHCCHNIDLYEAGSQYLPVPYDFDLAGLVSASYAKPDPSLRLRNVKQRRYRGYCIPTEHLQSALEQIVSGKPEVLAVLTDITGLPDKQRRDAEKYIGRFFEEAAKPARLLQKFERGCL
ncbi:MAG: hypothetical protein KJO82_04585 [Gammaproteobacteria bacterium]|nr:hypothetical protein [Gammaproteobacteria bacterium]